MSGRVKEILQSNNQALVMSGITNWRCVRASRDLCMCINQCVAQFTAGHAGVLYDVTHVCTLIEEDTTRLAMNRYAEEVTKCTKILHRKFRL
jgi:hypothetical protein